MWPHMASARRPLTQLLDSLHHRPPPLPPTPYPQPPQSLPCAASPLSYHQVVWPSPRQASHKEGFAYRGCRAVTLPPHHSPSKQTPWCGCCLAGMARPHTTCCSSIMREEGGHAGHHHEMISKDYLIPHPQHSKPPPVPDPTPLQRTLLATVSLRTPSAPSAPPAQSSIHPTSANNPCSRQSIQGGLVARAEEQPLAMYTRSLHSPSKQTPDATAENHPAQKPPPHQHHHPSWEKATMHSHPVLSCPVHQAACNYTRPFNPAQFPTRASLCQKTQLLLPVGHTTRKGAAVVSGHCVQGRGSK